MKLTFHETGCDKNMSDVFRLYKKICPHCGEVGKIALTLEDLDDRTIIVCSNCGKDM